MDIDEFVSKLERTQRLQSGWSARCPAHDDHVSSLMVNVGKLGGIVVHCHAGCQVSDVVAALHLSMGDLRGKPRQEARYEYRDDFGTLLYTVVRFSNPKTFRCEPGLPVAAKRVLYRSDLCRQARETGGLIYVVEGEKDVDRLAQLGHLATTNVGGALKWLPHYSAQLAGTHVCVIADDDTPGRQHARAVAAAVASTAFTVTLTLAGGHKDVSELLDAGETLDALTALPDKEQATAYRASTVRTSRVDWAWNARFAFGKLSLVEGDPGDGKSILSLDLAARWSSGLPMPDSSVGYHGPVVLVSAEDDMGDTIVPRLISAGADLDNVYLVPHGATPEEPFQFSTGLAGVEQLMGDVGARAVIFDPLLAFVGDDTDSHNDHSVRRALYPLMSLSNRRNVCVLAIRHLNKGSTATKVIYRGGGSIGFSGAARATHLVHRDPGDPDARILAAIKNNLAPLAPSMRYVIESDDEGVPFLRWTGYSDLDAQSLVDGPERGDSEYTQENRREIRARKREAMEEITEILMHADGPLAWHDIVKLAKVNGWTEKPLRDARSMLGLRKIYGSGGNRTVEWALPEKGLRDSSFPKNEESEALHLGPQKVGNSGKRESSENSDDREQKLMLADPVCDVCGSLESVGRFGAPWWVVRCADHNPLTYAGGSSI